MPPADGSLTRGGSTSVCGRVCSPHISSGRPPAGSQRANSLGSCASQPACYSLGCDRQTDRQTDGSQYRLMPPHGGDIALLRCVCTRILQQCVTHEIKSIIRAVYISASFYCHCPHTVSIPIHDSNRFDSIRYANRFESIRFVKKIGLSIHQLSCSFSCLFIVQSQPKK